MPAASCRFPCRAPHLLGHLHKWPVSRAFGDRQATPKYAPIVSNRRCDAGDGDSLLSSSRRRGACRKDQGNLPAKRPDQTIFFPLVTASAPLWWACQQPLSSGNKHRVLIPRLTTMANRGSNEIQGGWIDQKEPSADAEHRVENRKREQKVRKNSGDG